MPRRLIAKKNKFPGCVTRGFVVRPLRGRPLSPSKPLLSDPFAVVFCSRVVPFMSDRFAVGLCFRATRSSVIHPWLPSPPSKLEADGEMFVGRLSSARRWAITLSRLAWGRRAGDEGAGLRWAAFTRGKPRSRVAGRRRGLCARPSALIPRGVQVPRVRYATRGFVVRPLRGNSVPE